MTFGPEEKLVAKWRRTGYGVWYMTYVVEGYDDTCLVRLPGRMSFEKAKEYGREQVAIGTGEKKKHVIFRDAYKEP